MAQLKIRAGQAQDIAPLDRLLTDSYPRLLAEDYPPSVLDAVLPRITKAQPELVTSGTYFVAWQGSRLVGGGGWTRRAPGSIADPAQDTGHIRHFATDVTAVRSGIATALMTRVLDTAQANGIAMLHCLSTRTAVPFYEKMGFVPGDPVDVPLGDGIMFPAVQMWRKVTP